MSSEENERRRAEIEALLFANRKIEAIKLYRESNGGGLKEAKEAVDAVEVLLKQHQPEKFSPSSRGCGTTCFLVLMAGILLFSLFT